MRKSMTKFLKKNQKRHFDKPKKLNFASISSLRAWLFFRVSKFKTFSYRSKVSKQKNFIKSYVLYHIWLKLYPTQFDVSPTKVAHSPVCISAQITDTNHCENTNLNAMRVFSLILEYSEIFKINFDFTKV